MKAWNMNKSPFSTTRKRAFGFAAKMYGNKRGCFTFDRRHISVYTVHIDIYSNNTGVMWIVDMERIVAAFTLRMED